MQCPFLCRKDLEYYDYSEASAGPLQHSRRFIEHFMKNAAKIAIPIGSSALDEIQPEQ